MKTDLRGKKVLIVGTGISGIGAAEVLCRVGACPVLYDENEKLIKTADLRYGNGFVAG